MKQKETNCALGDNWKKMENVDKKEVLLITLEGTDNYGNRLQHFALKMALEAQGCKVTNLMIRGKPEPTARMYLKLFVLTMLKQFYRKKLSQTKRMAKIIGFNRKYIGEFIYMSVDEVRQKSWDEYNYAVTGSDQVWHNWHWKTVPDELSYFYLEFMPPEKRVSYAPSFGFTEFPAADVTEHYRGLMNMKALSCRELEGCEMIQALTGRKTTKVLDPTLLMQCNEWLNYEKKPNCKLPRHYLVQYFLGSVTDEYLSEIERLRTKFHLQVVNLQDIDNSKYYGLSPLELIWTIHNADIVCTDSFHVCVFSILLERNLRVYKRRSNEASNMFGRLYDLLEPLGLVNNIFGVGENLSTALNEEAKAYLDKERENSIQYLRNSLSISDI